MLVVKVSALQKERVNVSLIIAVQAVHGNALSILGETYALTVALVRHLTGQHSASVNGGNQARPANLIVLEQNLLPETPQCLWCAQGVLKNLVPVIEYRKVPVIYRADATAHCPHILTRLIIHLSYGQIE